MKKSNQTNHFSLVLANFRPMCTVDDQPWQAESKDTNTQDLKLDPLLASMIKHYIDHTMTDAIQRIINVFVVNGRPELCLSLLEQVAKKQPRDFKKLLEEQLNDYSSSKKALSSIKTADHDERDYCLKHYEEDFTATQALIYMNRMLQTYKKGLFTGKDIESLVDNEELYRDVFLKFQDQREGVIKDNGTARLVQKILTENYMSKISEMTPILHSTAIKTESLDAQVETLGEASPSKFLI